MTKGKNIRLKDASVQHIQTVYGVADVSTVEVSIDKEMLSLVFKDGEPICSLALKATNLFRTVLHAFLEQIQSQKDIPVVLLSMVGNLSFEFSFDPEEAQDRALLTLEQLDEDSESNEDQIEFNFLIGDLQALVNELDRAFKAKMVN